MYSVSTINDMRSRKAYTAKVSAFKALVSRRSRYAKTMRKIIAARAARTVAKRGKTLVSEIIIPKGTKVDTLPVPKSCHDAITGPYRRYWAKAIAEELTNLREYKV